MGKSILLLGGSAQQVVAIQTAKKLGYRTVLCDYLPDNPGQNYADIFYLESTTDREKMLEVAIREEVDGVLAYASDPAAPTAAYVAEKLGLPTNPLSAVETMSVKHLFRKHLSASGLPCPRAYSFDAATDVDTVWEHVKGFHFPLVIKPTDSSGSKGVSVIADKLEIGPAINHAASYARNSVLLAEEYLEQSFPHVIGGDILS